VMIFSIVTKFGGEVEQSVVNNGRNQHHLPAAGPSTIGFFSVALSSVIRDLGSVIFLLGNQWSEASQLSYAITVIKQGSMHLPDIMDPIYYFLDFDRGPRE